MKRRRLNIPISTSSQTYAVALIGLPLLWVGHPSTYLKPALLLGARLQLFSLWWPPSLLHHQCSLFTHLLGISHQHTNTLGVFTLKKKRTSPHTYLFQLPLHFSDLTYGKTIEQIVFSFSSNFSPVIVSWSHSNQSFVAQDCHKNNPVMVQRLPSQ